MQAADLSDQIVACQKCPRLIEHCRHIASVRRRAYMDEEYWGKPVPSFGPLSARLLILGLAPGAHGANRTGRVFTGDSSGNLLFRVLHAAGFASQPISSSRDDGLTLHDARITCAVHCAPPDNKPLPAEIRACRYWLQQELALMPNLKVVVALGRLAFDNYCALKGLKGLKFAHNLMYADGSLHPTLICSYHPSQQNTSTGKLTERMFQEVFDRAAGLLCDVD